ncbi:MAG TPA: PA14 domain-containing protein [Planctomycetota bacterium]|jgi:hypothetical protein
MILIYCEGCGRRILEAELQSGAAQKLDENEFLCGKCSAERTSKLPTGANAVLPTAKVPSGVIKLPPTGRHGAVSPATQKIPTSQVPRVTTEAISVDAVRKSTARAAAEAKAKKVTPMMIGAIAGGVVLLGLGVGLIIASGGGSPPKTATVSQSTDTAKPAAVVAPKPDEKPLKLAQAPLPAPIPAPAAADKKTKEETPEKAPPAPVDEEAGDFRAGYALRMLDEALKYHKDHPDDVGYYHTKLDDLAEKYASLRAGKDAAKLRDELKAPEGGWAPGFVYREVWNGIGGSRVGDLLKSPKFPAHPDSRSKVTSLAGPNGAGDDYGARFRGYLMPPADGAYTFFIYSDDEGILFLSTDETPAKKVKIAECPCVGVGEWEKLPSQKSAPIALSKGKKYYFEVLHKEGKVDDFVAVGWQMPDGTPERPITGARLAPCELSDEQATTTIAAAPAQEPPSQPAATSPAPEPAPQAKDAAPADDPFVLGKLRALQAQLEYEDCLQDVYGLLAKRAVMPALARLEQAKANAKLADQRPLIEVDIAMARYIDDVIKAIAAAPAKLDGKTAMELKKVDGKSIKLGAANKATLKSFKDNMLSIERDLGGGTATVRVALDELMPDTVWELARAGMPADGESKVKLALAALANLSTGKSTFGVKAIRALLDEAEKEKAPADKLKHLRGRLAAIEREESAEAEFHKAEALIKDKKFPEAKAALDNLGKDYSGTRAMRRFAPAIAERMVDVEAALNPLVPGLWTCYWFGIPGNTFQKFIFGKATAKLVCDWGQGSPDPKVPNDHFGIRFRGLLRIEQDGSYRFQSQADDEIFVWIDGKEVSHKNEGSATLSKGDHEIKIDYKEYAGGASMAVRWQPPGANGWQEIPEANLWHDARKKPQYEQ